MPERDGYDALDTLDARLHLAQARLRLAELGRCRPGSVRWREAAASLLRAAEGLEAAGEDARGVRERLEMVGWRNRPEDMP